MPPRRLRLLPGRTASIMYGESSDRLPKETRMNLPRMSTLLLAALALGPAACTYYQTAPGVYAPTPSAFDRSWSAAVGALEDEGVHVANLDRATGTASGSRG